MIFWDRRILLNVVGVGRTAEVYDCQRSGVEGETETDAQHASEFVCFLLFSLNMSAEKLIHVFRLVGHSSLHPVLNCSHSLSLSEWLGSSVPYRTVCPSYTEQIELSFRSSHCSELTVLSLMLSVDSHRSFSVSGPTGWNALLDYLREILLFSLNCSNVSSNLLDCSILTRRISALQCIETSVVPLRYINWLIDWFLAPPWIKNLT